MFLGNCSLKFLLAANTVRDELKIVTSHKLRSINKLVTLTCIIHEDVLRKEEFSIVIFSVHPGP